MINHFQKAVRRRAMLKWVGTIALVLVLAVACTAMGLSCVFAIADDVGAKIARTVVKAMHEPPRLPRYRGGPI